MEKKLNNISERWVYVLIILFSVAASLPLLRGDFYHFSDEPHIANLYQMIRGFQSGQVPPRWAPDMSFGYGYPLFNFYYPMPFYLGSLIFAITGSLIDSLKLVFLFTIPVSGMAMYLWMRQHTNKLNALVGSIIYIYTPYRAVDLYVRGAIGEAFAFLMFPLVAYAGYKTITVKNLRGVGILALVVGVFILSHNLAPMFFFPWLVAYLVILAWSKGSKKSLVASGVGLFLGFGLSIYWWLPALLEKGLLVTQTPFNYVDHFPFIKQLIFSSWGYGASHPGIYDDLTFQIGVVNIFLIVTATYSVIRYRANLKLKLFLLSSIAATLFFMNIRSTFLWELSGIANYIQFPWRLLMMTTFLTSALVMFIRSKKLAVLLGILSIVLTIGYFKPSEYYNPNDDYFLKRFFADRSIEGMQEEFSEEYLNYSEDYLLLPLWVTKRPNYLPESKFLLTPGEIEVEELSSVFYKAKANLEEDGLVEINIYNFPGWIVRVNGKKTIPEVLKPRGNMGVRLERGSYEIEVEWVDTGIAHVSGLVSVASLLMIISFILYGRKRVYD